LSSVPAGQITVAPVELLQKLAPYAPKAKVRQKTTSDKGPWTRELLQEYIDLTGWHYREAGVYSGSKFRWIGPCIADDSHKDSVVILHEDGWWSYSCPHVQSHEKQSARLFREHFAGTVETQSPAYKYPRMAKSKFESTAWELEDIDVAVPKASDARDVPSFDDC
jgi:hypothetical protein